MVMVNKAEVLALRQTYPGSVESVPASGDNGSFWIRQEQSVVYKGANSKLILMIFKTENLMPSSDGQILRLVLSAGGFPSRTFISLYVAKHIISE